MRIAALLGVSTGLLLLGCDHAGQSPAEITIPVFSAAASNQFTASPMRGGNEHPATDSHGAGTATFRLSDDGTSLDYRLIVANIADVTQSHIHIGPASGNGPVVVFLFGFVAGGVTQNGVLAEGTITQANLIPRPAIGFGGTMAELIAAMRAGNAYVNVHTVAHPGGEIRAQFDQ